MLMYSKEANNRKQEIDRQHHTIPNQRANDKHHGNVYNLNKTYGIDRETGELIPKERLRAVPHATLSVASKEARKK